MQSAGKCVDEALQGSSQTKKSASLTRAADSPMRHKSRNLTGRHALLLRADHDPFVQAKTRLMADLFHHRFTIGGAKLRGHLNLGVPRHTPERICAMSPRQSILRIKSGSPHDCGVANSRLG